MRIVLGITGGIAAYKAAALIRLLTEAGHEVQVVPTANALRFIGSATLEALSHHAVDSDLYTDVADVKHVKIGQMADLVIVAPATASFLARYASGIADDLLGNVLLATKAPVLIAPAMHTEMWQHLSTVSNVATLRARGVSVLEPDSGRLTGQDTGPGRLPEPEDIIAAALRLTRPQDLSGRTVLVTAGGTQEAIDPVRFIGNRSSGKQGIAIAREARDRGARVLVVAANVTQGIRANEFDEVVEVVTAQQLEQAVADRLSNADALVMAAAVSDFRVEEIAENKLKRSEIGEQVNLKLIANADILKNVVARVANEKLPVITVGFAAETAGNPEKLLELARLKLNAKGCDLLVANDVSGGQVFDQEHNSVHIMHKSGTATYFEGSKTFIGERVIDALVEAFS